ncbi:hypothetical protein ACFVUS_22250 [Nocardia sp. NPDC058058]|uniref:hypothetical protein n=1 Tax=Nocardia sp. NPDC058058 TaxID=3346317 RepID=UPI0036DBAE35
MSAAWFGLAGALGGVALTALTGLVVAILNHRWQVQHAERQFRHDLVKALREERREAYVRFWSEWNRLNDLLVRLRDEVSEYGSPRSVDLADLVANSDWPQMDSEWREAAGVLLLIGGPGVVLSAEEFLGAVYAKAAAARSGERFATTPAYQRLNAAMRDELLP